MSSPAEERDQRQKNKIALISYAIASAQQLLVPRLELRATFPLLTAAFNKIDLDMLKKRRETQP